jgi:hypothetical protein
VVGEVPQGAVVLGEVKTRTGVGRRGVAPGRSSWPRKVVGGRGVGAVRWREESKREGASPLQSRAKG